ncbi:MAG TPA: FkbM family methyltransferase [Thermoanaerobaculia bacterium]|jgi:FkbM family methyltransferase
MRGALKSVYLALPLKKQLFGVVRRAWTPPESVLRYLYFRGAFPVEVRGRTFELGHYGYTIETDIYWRGLFNGWEAASLRLWADLSERSRTIVDIGANTGIYALIAKTLNPSARVYAFEPLARVYEKLVENVRRNAYDIHCRLEAVSNYDGSGEMFDLEHEHVYSVALDRDVNTGSNEGVRRAVGVVRMDTFIARENIAPDLIKIDVESREPEVIEGLGAYLAASRPTMLVEIWHDDEHGRLEIGSRVEALVRGKGYRYFRVDEERGAIASEHIGAPGRGYSNFLICTEEVARSIGLS